MRSLLRLVPRLFVCLYHSETFGLLFALVVAAVYIAAGMAEVVQ